MKNRAWDEWIKEATKRGGGFTDEALDARRKFFDQIPNDGFLDETLEARRNGRNVGNKMTTSLRGSSR